jgi:hypothetical protein
MSTRNYTETGILLEESTLRVSITPDGRFDIVDFTTPRQDGRFLHQDAPQEDIPAWVIEAISILRITEPRSVVNDIGFKVNDKLYYIVDKRGDHECEEK